MKKLILIMWLLVLSQAVQAQADVNFDEIDEYLEQTVQDWGIPGMSVAIVKDGKIVFSKGYGVKEAGKKERPDGNTLYAIASNSKAFTSAVIATLVQEGKLNWNDKVKTHLPYFEVYDPNISQMVTLRDLLSHRVGLGTFSGDIMWYQSDFPVEEIIRRIRYVPQAFEFRAGYGYSNLMFITAGELIHQVTGKSYAQNVKERLLTPIGMDRTTCALDDLEKLGNYASPHALVGDSVNVPIPWTSWEKIAATGGLISSVNDVAKWMIFNMNHGIVGTDTILTPASRNLMWAPHNNFVVKHTTESPYGRNFNGYGLGWSLRDYHNHFQVSHTGGYDGMITSVNMLPDEKLGVVVLTNGMKSPINAVTHYIYDRFLGRPMYDWSANQLERRNNWRKRDRRIPNRIKARIPDTKPSLPLEKYAGTYYSDLYGNIFVKEQEGKLSLDFEHSEFLDATLEHWHYDTWRITWKSENPWFTFGTVKFTTNNDMRVKGIEFDVPNDDFYFEEINSRKID
ncbi:MAG: serine hydrolase [Bacteroidota bacterium]